MLSAMKRLMRKLTVAGLVAGSALTSLAASAQDQTAVPPPPPSAPLPAPGSAPNAPLPPPGTTAEPPQTEPSARGVGPQTEPSAEPPNASEYDSAADTDPAALNDFRDTLSPYGVWTEDATYGTVWTPNSTVVGSEFSPYVTDGHWALTDDSQWI